MPRMALYLHEGQHSSREPRVYTAVEGRRQKQYNDAYCDTASSYTQQYTYRSSEDSESESTTGGCLPWAKYGIFAANVVFVVVGLIVLIMGVWLRTDSRFRDFLSERYRLAVHDAFWQAPTLYAFSYIMIVLGACMIVVAMFGCCGASTRGRPVLITYSCTVFLLMIFTLASGIYILYKKDGVDVELSDALNYMVQHYYQGPSIVQESLDRLQQTFRCCGNAGCSDFRVFRQDPPRTCDLRGCDGCHFRIWQALVIGFSVTLVVFFFVLLFQVLAIALSLYLVFSTEEKVRVVYCRPTQPPFPQPTPLTRQAVAQHDLPYALQHKPKRFHDPSYYHSDRVRDKRTF